jgi:hypothetical protein
MIEMSVLFITAVVLERICRLNSADVLAFKVSGIELVTIGMTLLRLSMIAIVPSVSFEYLTYRQIYGFFSVFWVHNSFNLAIVYLSLTVLVHQGAVVARLERSASMVQKAAQQARFAVNGKTDPDPVLVVGAVGGDKGSLVSSISMLLSNKVEAAWPGVVMAIRQRPISSA